MAEARDQVNEVSETVRLDAREERCKFRFSIRNFQLHRLYQEQGTLKNIKSSPFLTGGAGIEELEWQITISFTQDENGTRIYGFVEERSVLGNYVEKIAKLYVVTNTDDLEPLDADGLSYEKTIMQNAITFLPDDTLTILCQLCLVYPVTITRCELNGQMLESSLNSFRKLQSDFRNLYESQRDSDVTIRCGDEEIKAHKLVLSTRSAVFAKMFEHDMKESRENVVEIEDAAPEIIKAMLMFLYCSELDEQTTETYIQLYSIAHKYELMDLKCRCSMLMKSGLNSGNVCEVAILAYLHDDQELLLAIKYFFNSNYPSIVATLPWVNLIRNFQPLAKEIVRL